MKRYVKEFANDEMSCCTERRRKQIRKILAMYESGIITAREAVAGICGT